MSPRADDSELFEAWRADDATAGNLLFRRYFGAVFRFFHTKVAEDSAAELTQRTFLACTKNRDRILPAAGFRAYVLGVARIELLRFFDELRRHGGRIDPGITSLHDIGPSPTGRLALLEAQEQVLGALRRLPLDFQITLELHYWEGLTLVEVATVLGVAPGTVKSRLHRARALLRAVMVEPGPDR